MAHANVTEIGSVGSLAPALPISTECSKRKRFNFKSRINPGKLFLGRVLQ